MFIGAPRPPVSLSDLGEHRLRDLAEPERLYQVDHPDFELHDFEPLPSLTGNRPNNLLIQPNAFIGREKELSELRQMLADGGQRLVTIIAPGGYGKSRLAVQFCADRLDDFKNGVFAVLLAPVGDHSRIVGATADSLGFQFYGASDPKEQLLNYLREKEMLVHFDNFEHVMEGRELVGDILATAPGVSVLVTSREPLRLKAEKVFQIEPLPVEIEGGDGLSDAEILFIDRASLVEPGFDASAFSAKTIREICSRLEGVPLSLELAAAWADSFTLSELKSELESQIELIARMADVPERHRSIRASLDWSYNLLTDEQRAILRAVSCFRGGFFAEGGEAVTGIKGLRMKLAGLCDKSWLYTRESLGKTRFFVRDAAAREYSFKKLKESADWENIVSAHSKYYANLLDVKGAKLKGHGQLEAVRMLTVEFENLLEALDTALNSSAEELILPFAEHLSRYSEMVSKWIQCLPWYERILETGDSLGSETVRMKALLGIGNLSWRLGRYAEASGKLEQARILAESLGERKSQADSLRGIGLAAYSQGRYADAEKFYNKSLVISREAGYMHSMARVLIELATVIGLMGQYEKSLKLNSESLKIFRVIGDRRGISICLCNMGNAIIVRGRYAEAEKLINESLEIFREFGERSGIAYCLLYIGNAAKSQGRYADAETQYENGLEIFREIGDRNGIAWCHLNLGIAATFQGRNAEAEKLYGDGREIFREIGNRRGIAFSLLRLGHAAYMQGWYAQSEKLLGESLDIFREIGDRQGIAAALYAIAQLRLTTSDISAARLFLVEAFGIMKEPGDLDQSVESLLVAGALLEIAGNPEDGAVLLVGATHNARYANYHPNPLYQREADASIERLEKEIDSEKLAQLSFRGEAMTLAELIEFAEERIGDLVATIAKD